MQHVLTLNLDAQQETTLAALAGTQKTDDTLAQIVTARLDASGLDLRMRAFQALPPADQATAIGALGNDLPSVKLP